MRRAWLIAAVALFAAGCSDGGGAKTAPGADAGAADAVAGAPDSATVTVTPIDAGVEVKKGSADFVAITAPTELAAGDLVRTDGTGFAEINYPDGSITRLDVDTEFEVVSITDDAGVATTRADLNGGRVWNRVQELGSEGEFSIDTAVGVATVRGTAWIVDCRTTQLCQFSVLEGKVDVSPPGRQTTGLEGPHTMQVSDVESSAPQAVMYDEAFGDPWIVENVRRDAEAGFDPADRMYEPYGPLMASFDGQYNGSGAIVPLDDCAVPGSCSSAVGSAYMFDYVFSVECDGFMSCTRWADMTYTKDGVTSEARASVQFHGSNYMWTLDLGGTGCDVSDPGKVVFTLDPLAAVKAGGKWVITDVTLQAVLEAGSGCPGGVVAGGGTDDNGGGGGGDDDCEKNNNSGNNSPEDKACENRNNGNNGNNGNDD